MIPDNPLSFLNSGGGGISLSDETKISFDPFSDQRKSSTLNQNIKNMPPLAWVAIAVLGGIVLWKLLK